MYGAGAGADVPSPKSTNAPGMAAPVTAVKLTAWPAMTLVGAAVSEKLAGLTIRTVAVPMGLRTPMIDSVMLYVPGRAYAWLTTRGYGGSRPSIPLPSPKFRNEIALLAPGPWMLTVIDIGWPASAMLAFGVTMPTGGGTARAGTTAATSNSAAMTPLRRANVKMPLAKRFLKATTRPDP